MLSQKEAVDAVNGMSAQMQKIAIESKNTLQRVADLEAAAANSGGISQQLSDAIVNMKNQVQIVDDLVPDVSSTPGTGDGSTPGAGDGSEAAVGDGSTPAATQP